MGREKNPPYTCPRCNYETLKKCNMEKHLYGTKRGVCPGHVNNIDLTEDIKQFILANRIYNMATDSVVQGLKKELMFYKNKKDETFFQDFLEEVLGGTHKKLNSGITDVTTTKLHAEIKQWVNWKSAIGQLIAYSIEDPREEMRMYLFGKCTKKMRKVVLETLETLDTPKICPYECVIVKDGVEIVNLITNATEMHNFSSDCNT